MGQLATVSQKGTAVLLRLTLPNVEQFFCNFFAARFCSKFIIKSSLKTQENVLLHYQLKYLAHF